MNTYLTLMQPICGIIAIAGTVLIPYYIYRLIKDLMKYHHDLKSEDHQEKK